MKGVSRVRFKILKKDLKRKRSMNVVIMIFVIMTTMFVAASINNLRVCLSGVDEFMDISHIRDYMFLVRDENDYQSGGEDTRLDFLADCEYVDDYFVDHNLALVTGDMMDEDGRRYKFSSTLFLQGFSQNQVFFDSKNNAITEVKTGTIYLPKEFLEENDIEAGDVFQLKYGDGKYKSFTIEDTFKDAFLGSSLMGNKRALISMEEFDEVAAESSFTNILFYGVSTDDVAAFKKALGESDIATMFAADRKLIGFTYVLDMVIALVLLLVGVVLVIVSAIMLRYTITFTVNEDYKEIGIMKAIGLKSKSVRKLYASKYMIISVVGALIGFILAIPFSKLLLQTITNIIVLKNQGSGCLLEFVVAAVVAMLVTFLAYNSTKIIKKLTPMDAIRGGNNGERFKRKNVVSLSKSRSQATTFMAISDVFAEWKKYVVLIITSILGVWLVVMPSNTINTLNSENIVAWFGMVRSDYAINSDTMTVELINDGSDENCAKKLDEIKQNLIDSGQDVDRVTIEVIFVFTARKGEKTYTSAAMKGYNTTTDEYMYDEGKAPYYEDEIAITHIVAEEIDAEIGDTIYVNNGDEEKPYRVTAIYQTMNNQGQGMRFGELADIDYSKISGSFGFQVFLNGEPDKKAVDTAIEQAQEIYPDAKVLTMKELSDEYTGGAIKQLAPIKNIILVVVLIINLLVVTLMQKMFVIREQGEMGMLKAIGFTNQAIVKWQAKRAFCALLAGTVIGAVTGTFFSQLSAGMIFKMMGASKIKFVIKPLEVYLLYPAILVIVTIVGCIIATRSIKRINVFNMNEMD